MTDQQTLAILTFAHTQPQTARAIFDLIIAQESDADRRAKIEMLREWACNPAFAQRLREYVWTLNNND